MRVREREREYESESDKERQRERERERQREAERQRENELPSCVSYLFILNFQRSQYLSMSLRIMSSRYS